MSEITLSATERSESGKGPARQLRAKGLIPAILYGPRQKATSLFLKPEELYEAVTTDVGFNALIRLKISGEAGKAPALGETTILVKDIQIDTLKRRYIHADLLQVNPDDQVTVEIPIILTGKAAGVKEGGILQQTLRLLQMVCLAGAIPKKIEIDVSAMDIGDSLHLSDLKLPEGARPVSQINLTVCACVPPEKEEVVEAPTTVLTAEGAPVEGAVAGAAPAAGAPGAPGADAAKGGAAGGKAAPDAKGGDKKGGDKKPEKK